MPQLSLADAAELVVLAAQDDSQSFDLLASRWAARYVLEQPGVAVEEAALVLVLFPAFVGATGGRPRSLWSQ